MQSFEQTPPEAREFLSRRIRDLGLRLALAAGIAGRTYRELIGQIVELALARYAA